MSPVALPAQTAAVLYGAKDLRIEERTLWPPGPNQVQVAIVKTGLCGSDCLCSIFFIFLHGFNTTIQCTITHMVAMVILLFGHP